MSSSKQHLHVQYYYNFHFHDIPLTGNSVRFDEVFRKFLQSTSTQEVVLGHKKLNCLLYMSNDFTMDGHKLFLRFFKHYLHFVELQ